jgi:hypothetical protein
LHRQHRGRRDPSALAEAEVMRRPVCVGGHADGVEGAEDAPVELGTAQPEIGRAECDVVTHCRHEQLVVGILEDDADPPADLGEVTLDDGEAGDAHLAVRGEVDAVQVQYERGLARTVGPEERHLLAGLDREVDAEQRVMPVGI